MLGIIIKTAPCSLFKIFKPSKKSWITKMFVKHFFLLVPSCMMIYKQGFLCFLSKMIKIKTSEIKTNWFCRKKSNWVVHKNKNHNTGCPNIIYVFGVSQTWLFSFRVFQAKFTYLLVFHHTYNQLDPLQPLMIIIIKYKQ